MISFLRLQWFPWFVYFVILVRSIIQFISSNSSSAKSDDILLYGTIFVVLWVERYSIYATLKESDDGYTLESFILLLIGVLIYMVGRLYPVFDLEIWSYFIFAASIVLSNAPKKYLRSGLFILSSGTVLAILGRIAPELLSSRLAINIASATAYFLSATVLPVVSNGVYLYFGPYTAEVTHACSGMNSIFSLFALSLLYLKEGVERTTWHVLSLIVVVIPVAILTNIIRVIMLVIVTWFFGERFSSGPFHEVIGVMVFIISLGILISIDKLFFIISVRYQEKKI